MIQSYRDLEVWRQAMDLTVACYEIAASLPREEAFGLAAQIRRCAVSIPANIAEGHGRHHTKEFIHFVSIANGSLRELETHLLLCGRLGFVEPERINELLCITESVGKMLVGLRQSLQRRLS